VPDTTLLLSQIYLDLDGQTVSDDMMSTLEEVVIENSLHLPDVATLSLGDPRGQWVDNEHLAPGSALIVRAKLSQGQDPRVVFEGEIVELEPEYVPGRRRLIVRAFDRMHRLARGRHVRSFQNVTDGDVIKRIAQETGLDTQLDPTTEVRAFVLQDNETNLEFLRERAAALGYLLYVRGKTLYCEEPKSDAPPIALQWGETMGEFRPRLSTIGQTDSVTVRGWDPVNKLEIVGQANDGHGAPKRDQDNRSGSQVTQSAFNVTSEMLITDRAVRSQGEADRLAQAVMDRSAARFIAAEAVATGNPEIIAGVPVKLSGLGTRFDGTYFVTGATHTYSHSEGYSTRFVVAGHEPTTLLGLLQPPTGQAEENNGGSGRVQGLVVGIVTDNADPTGQSRVKVKFPTLSGDHASDWARIVMSGAGETRGLLFIPEVNDEVLVGFEHGDVHQPYILGGLWNGKDAPPTSSSDIVASGKVKQRIIKSRLGHTVTLDDSDDQPGITIVDKTGNNTIAIDSTNNKLTVKVQGDMSFQAQGSITIEASDTLTLRASTIDAEANNDLTARGMSATLQATQALSLKGMTAELSGDTTTTIKGNLSVSIN
jgi:phage protein D